MTAFPPSNFQSRNNHERSWRESVFFSALRDAWALLMPVECAGCQSRDRALCRECASSLIAEPSIQSTLQGLTVYSALIYEGRVRQMLLAFKNHHRTDLARILSTALVSAFHRALEETKGPDAPSSQIVFVAVPSSNRSFRTRGYHPMGLILRAAGIQHARVLRVTKDTHSQKLLSAEQRQINMDGAFVSVRSLMGTRVIIVDDVLTTGATLDEAARAIAVAGGVVVAAITLGFTPKKLKKYDMVGVERDIVSREDYGKEKGAQHIPPREAAAHDS